MGGRDSVAAAASGASGGLCVCLWPASRGRWGRGGGRRRVAGRPHAQRVAESRGEANQQVRGARRARYAALRGRPAALQRRRSCAGGYSWVCEVCQLPASGARPWLSRPHCGLTNGRRAGSGTAALK